MEAARPLQHDMEDWAAQVLLEGSRGPVLRSRPLQHDMEDSAGEIHSELQM